MLQARSFPITALDAAQRRLAGIGTAASGEQIALNIVGHKDWVIILRQICKRESLLIFRRSHIMVNPNTLAARMETFRHRCVERGLSVTHQRWVIYRVLSGSDQHPTPEATFEKVRRQIPTISLATVYNNINVFLDAGLLREVSTPQQTMRLDANLDSHHHLFCARCGSIVDLPKANLPPLHFEKVVPKGFRVESYSVNFSGLCGHCAPRA